MDGEDFSIECKGIANYFDALSTNLKIVSFQNVPAMPMDLTRQKRVILQLGCVFVKQMLLAKNVIIVNLDILIFQTAKVGFFRIH